jgi:DNA-binding NarL/FixJ family response regulator
MSTNRVLLITEEPVLASGLVAELASVTTLNLEVQVGTPSEVTTLVESRDPHVVLLDFVPADYPVLLELRSKLPNCKIVLWMRSVPIEVACQAMRLGVRGILRKTLGVDLLVKCLEVVAAGEFWFDKEMTAGFLESRTVELTPRESQLVPLVAQGLKNKEIAFELNVAEATVRIYLSALFRKLGVKDRYELAIYGIKNMLPPRGSSKDMAGEDHTGNGLTESARARLRFLVLDRPSAAPAASVRKTDRSLPSFGARARRAGTGRGGQ